MNVLIFAAGLGTRLKPFTDEHPKALAPVADVPALQRNLLAIQQINSVKVGKVVINIHHFPQQIRNFIGRQDFGFPIEFSDESDCLLDTGGGLLHASPLLTNNLLDDTLLLINADILTDMPLDDIIEAHKNSGADATLLCANRKSSRTLWFDSSERLIGWENLKTGETKPLGFASDINNGDSQSPFCGVHVLRASTVLPPLNQREGHPVFSIVPFYISQLKSLDIRRFLLPTNYHWFDIGTPEKLLTATHFFTNK